ncbi:hypothetical protein [uncultured Sphingomonas sp.]|uniref:hypothetical protein n=1 Tax=uncultured Sphingomonas sp. TaxID=158754 RepID=UPI0025EC4418|nr:hypothetical protein [uncultured Sphingomonas sp.]
MTTTAEAANGFAGSVRLGQTNALQHLLYRFRSRALLDAFRASEAFKTLVAEGEKLATGLDQVEDGRRVEIDLPSDASASPWKRFVVTWLSVLPVLLMVSTAARKLLPFLPAPLQVVASSLVLKSLLQWVILPRVQHAARAGMLKSTAGKLRT